MILGRRHLFWVSVDVKGVTEGVDLNFEGWIPDGQTRIGRMERWELGQGHYLPNPVLLLCAFLSEFSTEFNISNPLLRKLFCLGFHDTTLYCFSSYPLAADS